MRVLNFYTEFKRREATCVSKSNKLRGFSKHMWLFEENAGQNFCNYRIPPPTTPTP